MISLTIAFFCGSLTCMLVTFLVWLATARAKHDEITSLIQETKRRAYARGYEEGNLHGRGYFATIHSRS